jgi:excisionase family DNA binding protein
MVTVANQEGRMRKAAHREVEVSYIEARREWLNYKEAAELTGLGRTTLWSLASTGRVRAAKVGSAVRFSRRGLQEFMENSSYSEKR